LQTHAKIAYELVRGIGRLDSFLRGLQYRVRENPTAILVLCVRRDRSSGYDVGAEVRLEARRVAAILEPLIRDELRRVRAELRGMKGNPS